jgi:hypothetical protein
MEIVEWDIWYILGKKKIEFFELSYRTIKKR